MKRTLNLPAAQGVAEGSTAVFNLPIGWTYHGILLTRGGTFTHDMMTSIVLKANGKAIREYTGSDLDDINQFDGLAAAGANSSYLSFERVGLLSQADIEASAIGTADGQIATLTLEITINGATNPTLSAVAYQSAPSAMGRIIKVRKHSGYAPSAAGIFEISDLPKGDLINRIMIKAASDNILDVEMVRDNTVVFQRTAADNDYFQTDGVKVPQALWYNIDSTEVGVGNDLISSNAQDFRLKLNMSAADSLTIYVEYFGDLTGN